LNLEVFILKVKFEENKVMKKVVSYKVDGYLVSNSCGNMFSIQMPINSEILDFKKINGDFYIFALVDSSGSLLPYNFYVVKSGLDYNIFDTDEILEYVGLDNNGEYAIFEITGTVKSYKINLN
jgi:hypothetical protein